MPRINPGNARWLTAVAVTLSVAGVVASCTTAQETAPPATTAATARPTAAASPGTGGGSPGTGAGGKLPILAAVPNAPTRAPAATLAPGVTAAPAATTPPAQVRQITFYVDTVTAGPGESKYNVDADRYCTISSSFRRGMHIVWRLMAWNNAGKELQTADVKTGILKLPQGDTVNFRYGNHGGTWFWTAAWDAPLDYPLGVIDFTIEFTTNDGKTGTYKQIPVSLPERSIESRLNIIG